MPGSKNDFEMDSIPDRGDPDRKRALNILAQRRYPSGQRQREKLRVIGEKNSGKVSQRSQDPKHMGSSSTATQNSSTLSVESPMLQSNSSTALWNERSCIAAYGSESTLLDIPHQSSLLHFDPTALNNYESASRNFSSFDPLPISGQSSSVLTNWEIEGLSCELPNLEASQFTFPDESQLDVPIIKVLSVGLAIAEILGCADSIWDPNFHRVLDVEQLLDLGLYLPQNFVPTEAQKRYPHHPLLDMLPWPSVRTKLVCVFSRPPHQRPPAARDPMAVMNLAHDIDDDTEGIRILACKEGDAGAFDGKNWEIGQTFFRNWWWALDQRVIEQSNALRRQRGASQLSLIPD